VDLGAIWTFFQRDRTFKAIGHSASSIMSPSSELLIDVLTPDHLAVLGGCLRRRRPPVAQR
jgi:hypothetical protein